MTAKETSQQSTENPNLTIAHAITPFFLPEAPVRGRLIRLGALADAILSRHNTLPERVLALGGEALALVAAMATALKFKGSFSLQIKGDGPLSIFLADCTENGAVRFTAQMKESYQPTSSLPDSASEVFGKGYLAFTIDQGANMERHQGIVGIEGHTLSSMAEHYFETSEQHDCAIKLFSYKEGNIWQAGALILERIAGSGGHADNDDFSQHHQDLWDTAKTFANTLKQEEIFSSHLTANVILQRLFGTLNVQISSPKPLSYGCRCSRTRITEILENFSQDDLNHMAEDGIISVDCGFCNIKYQFQRDMIGASSP